MRSAALAVLVAACSFRATAGPSDALLHDGPSGADASAIDAPAIDARAIDAPAIDARTIDAPPMGPTGYAKQISVVHGKVVGDLTDFPLWIDISNDADLEAHARSDHSDVYFTDASGALVPYEITAWNQATGTLQAWLRAAQLSPTTSTPDPNVFTLRFGGSAAPIASAGSAVFDNDFAAVWHFEATSSSQSDATGRTPATVHGTVIGDAGQLGQGLTFTGSTTNVTFANPITGSGPSTLSAWVHEATPSGSSAGFAVLVLGTAQFDQARWFYSRYAGDNGSISAGLYSDDHLPANGIVPTATWTKVDWVYEGVNTRKSHLYINGTEIGGGSAMGPAATAGGSGYIANAPTGFAPINQNLAFDGTLDEVRIASTVRTAQWLQTEFANQSSPQTFYTVGVATAVP
jgi:hypothetical protein